MSVLSKARGEGRGASAPREAQNEHLLLDPIPQEEMNDMVLESMHRTGKTYWIVVAVLAVLALGGFVGGWVYQIVWGMGVAGISRPVFWGTYITNFVFWIGISHSGTFVSAVLRVFKAEFRRPLTRAAEVMTTTLLLVAVSFLGVHVGRTWRGYWILPYPNQRGLWPNFHSPFLWDEMAILSYFMGSTLYLIFHRRVVRRRFDWAPDHQPAGQWQDGAVLVHHAVL
jgi:Ni/Fe-hydrogenase subunit HybB-like protein